MSYQTMRQHLLNTFNKNNFEYVWATGERLKNSRSSRNPNINAIKYQYPNNYNLNLVVNFPGYKTNRNKYGKLVYDYRVDLNNIPISHVNIIVDIYNKAIQSQDAAEILQSFLIEIAQKGDDLNINKYKQLNELNIAPPSQELLKYVSDIHNNSHKTYLRHGNENRNYTLEELSTLIPLIVLQEDINYPMPRFQGRRMSFYRYLEAIYCAKPSAIHNLGEVIERALSHKRLELWNNCIDYRAITELANH